jgi:hypothetical protein
VGESTESNGKKKGSVIEIIAVDPNPAPPADLKIKSAKHRATATAAKYRKASESWKSYADVLDTTKDYIVKPAPRGGDKGVPTSQDEIDELAKQVYDAIVDTHYFFGTHQTPVGTLLKGNVDEVYIMRRSYDLVYAVIDFHENDVAIDVWNNSLNLVYGATKIDHGKRDNVLDDTFETRMANIILALRYHKKVAMDVVTDEATLKYAIFLAPRSKFLSKLTYAESNKDCGEVTKMTKAKAKELDKLQTVQAEQKQEAPKK